MNKKVDVVGVSLILLIALKIIGIGISWWLVFSPLYVLLGLAFYGAYITIKEEENDGQEREKS